MLLGQIALFCALAGLSFTEHAEQQSRVTTSRAHQCYLSSPSPCPVGSGARVQCFGHRDTTCEACVNGQNYSSHSSFMPCVSCTACLATEVLSRPCTASQDTTCICYHSHIRDPMTGACTANTQSGQERNHQEEEVPLLFSGHNELILDELEDELPEINLSRQPSDWSDSKSWVTTHYSNSKSSSFQYAKVIGTTVGSVIVILLILFAAYVIKVRPGFRRLRDQGTLDVELSTISGNDQQATAVPSRGYQKDKKGPPVFTLPLKDGFAHIGKEAVLRCVAEGFPAPTITWSKDGHILQSSDIFQIDDTEVVMHRVSAELAGRYRCEASNEFGTAVTYANVSVIGGFSDSTDDLPSVETTMNLGLSVVSPAGSQAACQAGPDSLYSSELQEHFQNKYPGTRLKIVPGTGKAEWNDEGTQAYLQRMTEQVSHYPGSLLEENEVKQREHRAKQIAELGYTELAIGHLSGRTEASVSDARVTDCTQ